MANDVKDKQEETQQPQSFQGRLLESATKRIEKNIGTQVDKKLQGGQDPMTILTQLMSSIGPSQGPSQQDVLGQITQLAQTPVGSGEKQGIFRSLSQGQGLTRPEKQEPLGFGKAIQVAGLQQKMGQQQQQLPTQKAQLIKLIQDIGEGAGINVLTGEPILKGKVEEARAVEQAKQEVKLVAARETKAQDIQTNFNTVVGEFKQLIAQAKGAGEEQGGLGLIPGMLGKINVAFKNPNYSRTAALPGQIKETSLVFNRILTGQNRVIKGVVQMVQDTLLTTLDPGTTIAAKTKQSLTNAFRIKLAFQKVGFTPDVLQKMTQNQLNAIPVQSIVDNLNISDEEQAELDAIIKDVLETPAAEQEQLPGFEQKGTKLGKKQTSRLKEIRARRVEIQKQLNQK